MAATRVHHLNCGTMCPAAARWVDGTSNLFERGRMVCHVLLVETESSGLVLVDSGIGMGDIAEPTTLPRLFRAVLAPVFDEGETAIRQVERLGYDPRDVRHVVVTHLDLDHAGGIGDFPWARIHVHSLEYDAAMRRATFADRARYLPRQWSGDPSWETYADTGDTFFGLEAVRPLRGAGDDVALIPLFGHSAGHSGVAVHGPDGWMLHAGDAYFHAGELMTPPRCPSGLRVFQNLAQRSKRKRLANADRLRALHAQHGDEVDIFCAHDPGEYDRHA